jgi:DNA invertase Pin-like site-specific DNA recombinase
MQIALYARVSTSEQEADRQLQELRDFAREEYPDAAVDEYVDLVSGTVEGGGEQYQALRDAIADGEVDLVVVHELSRLSRLGGGEIHAFIQYALENDTGVRDLEVGLSIDVDDSAVDRAVTEMIAGIMGDLARIEQQQKMRRIRSGIDAAKEAGKWTGRPPRGFTVEDGFLRVDVEEFLRVRAALERVATGDTFAEVSEDTGLPASTLRHLYDDRVELYLGGDANDDRLDAALEEVRPLKDAADVEPQTLEELVEEKLEEKLDS